MRQAKLGRWPALALPAALAAWREVKALRDAGGDPAAQRRERRQAKTAKARRRVFTVAKARQEFLAAHVRSVAPKICAEAKRLLERDLAPLAEREEYPHLADDPAAMLAKLVPLKPLVGGETMMQWQGLAEKREVDALFESVTVNHYDPCYERSTRRNYGERSTAIAIDLRLLGLDALSSAVR